MDKQKGKKIQLIFSGAKKVLSLRSNLYFVLMRLPWGSVVFLLVANDDFVSLCIL